MFLLFVVYCVV